MTMLNLDTIRTDGGTQSRATLNQTIVEDYAQIVREGSDFPPVVVFHDGKKHWLADGFHRVAAYQAAGAVEINAEVRQGTKRDAVLFSVGANATHGLPRSNADKRRAVMVLLNDKEWAAWSDRQIAKQCGVSHNFVSTLRPSLSSDDSEPRTFTTKHGTVAKMDTAKIGKADRSAKDAEQAANDAAREQARASLPDHIRRGEEAKARNGSNHAAVSGAKPVTELEAINDALNAKCEEQADYITAIDNDNADLKRRLAKLDDMVAQYEKGGFEAVIATRDERINGLLRQVEDVTADRAKLAKSVKFWKKTAIDLGYVSPNSQIEMEPEKPTEPAPEDLSEQAGF